MLAAGLEVVGPLFTQDTDELARIYDEISVTRQFPSGQRLVANLAIQPGERVLDLGCGTGLLADHIAGIVGPNGRVLGIDPLPRRIALAEARARAAGRSNLEFRPGNAYRLDELAAGGAGFDVVCLNAMLHWLPEKAGPLAACRRLLRSGGRIGINTRVKGEPSRLQEIATELLDEPPFDRYPRPPNGITFRIDADEMRSLLEAAAFALITLEVREIERVHPTAEVAVRFAEAALFGNFLGHLPDDLKADARSAIVRRLSAVATSRGIIQRRKRMIVVAAKR